MTRRRDGGDGGGGMQLDCYEMMANDIIKEWKYLTGVVCVD